MAVCVVPHFPSSVDSNVQCSVDLSHRKQIAVHHSATHLLHSVLFEASFPEGASTKQSLQTGSHITTESFTFDFYAGFLTSQLKDSRRFIQQIENRVNEIARSGILVIY